MSTPSPFKWDSSNLTGSEDSTMNSSEVLSKIYADARFKQSTAIIALFIFSYVLTFALCIVGNSMVCFVILKIPRMRTVTNYFLLNLAVSDLLVAIFCMPFTLLDNIIRGWPLGNVMCKLTPAVTVVSVVASVFTLVAIAVDRYYSVVHPTEPKPSTRTLIQTVAAIWGLSFVIMIPQVLLIEEGVMSYKNTLFLHLCMETSPLWSKVYSTIIFLCCYITPMAVIACLYAKIGFTVWAKPTPGGDRAPKEIKEQDFRKKVKVIKMLMVVVVLFAFSWLPLQTIFMLYDYGDLSVRTKEVVDIYVYPVAHWLSYFNSCMNPIIYGYFNQNFRNAFKSIFSSRYLEFFYKRKSVKDSRRPKNDQGNMDLIEIKEGQNGNECNL
ncbi:neuropeptide FF receptor 2-like [Branchiostoma lanceolatum]|uniref:neuropeptide FF receptor 2-like n=1 Tax=Branchiostoma lanceolatum TaxID=7740 RepID=UPI003455C455